MFVVLVDVDRIYMPALTYFQICTRNRQHSLWNNGIKRTEIQTFWETGRFQIHIDFRTQISALETWIFHEFCLFALLHSWLSNMNRIFLNSSIAISKQHGVVFDSYWPCEGRWTVSSTKSLSVCLFGTTPRNQSSVIPSARFECGNLHFVPPKISVQVNRWCYVVPVALVKVLCCEALRVYGTEVEREDSMDIM